MSIQIFVVTAGEYSDYGICHMFTSRKLAEKYIEIKTECDDYHRGNMEIEEWTADSLQESKVIKLYTSDRLIIETGVFDGRWAGENAEVVVCQKGRPYSRGYTKIHDMHKLGEYIEVVIGYSTKSSDHAHKLAVEGRQKILRKRSISP